MTGPDDLPPSQRRDSIRFILKPTRHLPEDERMAQLDAVCKALWHAFADAGCFRDEEGLDPQEAHRRVDEWWETYSLEERNRLGAEAQARFEAGTWKEQARREWIRRGEDGDPLAF